MLLVSFDSEVRKTETPHNDANFGIGTLGTARIPPSPGRRSREVACLLASRFDFLNSALVMNQDVGQVQHGRFEM